MWYLAVLVSAVLVLGIGVWIALKHELYSSLDDSLSKTTVGLSQYLERESDGDDLPSVLQEAHEYTSGLPAGHRLRLLGPDGTVLMAVPAADPIAPMFRKLTAVTVRGHHFIVELSAPVQPIDHMLSSLRNILIACVPIVLAGAALGGWWLSRTALKPVERMTATAESISLNDLSARLIVPKTGDELEHLGEAWNHMLDRLSNSVEKMRRFTADAAHELRTPIAIIRSTAELALRRDRDAADYRTALTTVGEEARNLSDLVADLLWLARNDAGSVKFSLEPVSAADLVTDVCRSIEPLATAREIQLTTRIADETLTILADRTALRRVVLILLDNAIKFSRREGTIEVRSASLENSTIIEVKDSGVGISSEDLPFIFDRFFTSDRSRNTAGVGLGLSIAKAIVDAHGGRIDVRSEFGAGSSFTVTLPYVGAAVRISQSWQTIS
jgi:heavy metal sensor kinase